MPSLDVIELSALRSRDKGTPLPLGKHQHWPGAIVLGVTNTNKAGLEPTYLDAAAIIITEGTLLPGSLSDLGRSDSAGLAVHLPAQCSKHPHRTCPPS